MITINMTSPLLQKAQESLLEENVWRSPTCLKRPDVLLAVFYMICLLVYFGVSRQAVYLIVALLIACVLGWNVAVSLREVKLARREMKSRIQSHIDSLNDHGFTHDGFNVTNIPSISVVRKLIGSDIKCVPTNLLLQGDTVLLSYGDVSPCLVESLDGTVQLVKGQLFKPSAKDLPSNSTGISSRKNSSAARHHDPNAMLFRFKVLETLVQKTIKASLEYSRPEPVVTRQLATIDAFIIYKVIWIVFGLNVIVNSCRLGFLPVLRLDWVSGFYFVIILPLYTIYPLLPFMAVPTLLLIARSYGNAQILCLFDAVQSSKTAFEDKDDVDEFDAAPAPTKDVTVDHYTVWKKFLDQLIKEDLNFLARTTGLIESLANVTVVCAIDREGTVAGPIPSLEQLYFFGEGGEPILLDVSEDKAGGIRFEDKDWKQYLPVLKPFGLLQQLEVSCTSLTGRKKTENHLKDVSMCMNGNIHPCRQACLCSFARELGFQKDKSSEFERFLSIETYVPSHYNALEKIQDYHFQVPSIFADVFRETTTDSFQLFSNGNPDFMLECCGDFWNGKAVEDLSEDVESRLTEFYQNAIISDMFVSAFAYRPLYHSGLRRFLPAPQIDPIYVCLRETTIAATDSNSKGSQGSSLNIVSTGSPKPHRGPRQQRKRLNQNRLLSRVDSSIHLHDMTDKEFFKEAIKGQTLLALATFIYPPKPNVVDVIEDLGLAGIRFVYFSHAPERESKAYAERLGLEIDWNSCIILSSDDGSGPGYLAIHDMKARLPRGIQNIRPHLLNVDDVPLHVSLFADCDATSIREMIKIFQENGEIVLCLGSSLNDMNVECFAIADISIGVDPIPGMKHRQGFQGPFSPLFAASGFITSPCALTLNSDTSLYAVTQIIQEARTLVENGRMGFSFYFGSHCALSSISFLSNCVLLPPIFSGYDLIFVSWIVLPIISFSLFFSPYRKTVMTEMVAKNVDHLKDKSRFAWYYVVRFCLIPPICCILIFALLLINVNQDPSPFDILDSFRGIPWDRLDDSQVDSMRFAQTISFAFYMVYMVVISASYVSRIESAFERPPFINKVWVIAAPVSMAIHLVFCACNLIRNRFSLSQIPWYVWFIGFIPIFLLYPLQELVKMHDKHEWTQFQKRSKLEFNTKLGMHSPL